VTEPLGTTRDDDAQDVLPIESQSGHPGPRPQVPFSDALLALGSIRGVGTKGLRSLVGDLGDDLGLLWEMTEDEVGSRFAKAKTANPANIAADFTGRTSELLAKGTSELDRLKSSGSVLLSPSEVPMKLRSLPDGPKWLFVQGNIEAMSGAHVAIVGSRAPTDLGHRAAAAAAAVAAAYPVTVVSGLAEGIDATAHHASMREGARNVAFLGHGLNTIFPATTAYLRSKIIDQGGAIVTEYLPGEHYRKEQFVQRNRLQAGLADLLVVVDARASGGTAHTARFAQKYRKEILALTWPGVSDLALELTESDMASRCEIFTIEGTRYLDQRIRSIADRYHFPTNSLSLVMRRLARESYLRKVRLDDLKALHLAIERLADEVSNE
jgi:DNA protecting protein DprA